MGIQIHTKPSQREVFRERLYSGEALMSIWTGLDNGLPTADTPPTELAPTNQTQPQWPVYQYFETAGLTAAPDVAEVTQLADLLQQARFRHEGQGSSLAADARDSCRPGLHHRHSQRRPAADCGERPERAGASSMYRPTFWLAE